MYSVAIIGCGDMGTKHAAAWSARDDANVVAVCDTNADRAQALANIYDSRPYTRWSDAIAQDGVNVVSVGVPACDHHDVTVAAARASRHVLCEKAMALTLAEADDMIAAACNNGVALSVCHQYRSLSRFRTMKQQIDAGRLGSPLYIRFTETREVRPKLAMHSRSKNGGPLHDMTGHLYDLGRFLTGAEALSVTATGAVFGAGKERLASVTDFGTDTAEILVRFDGGHCLSIGINWGLPENTPGFCHDLVHGPLGVMHTSDTAHPDRFLGDVSETLGVTLKTADGTEHLVCAADDDGPHACIAGLIGEIETGTRSAFDATEGRAALRLILAAQKAIDTGQTVAVAGQ